MSKTIKGIFGVFLVFVILGVGGWLYLQSLLKPLNASDENKVIVEIPLGSSISKVGQILEEKKIIKDALGFQLYTKISKDINLQAGKYELSSSMSVKEVAKALESGKIYKEAKYKIGIPEGTQLKDIAAIIGKEFKQDPKAVLNKINDPVFVGLMVEKHPEILTESIFTEGIRYPLEGYLFPSTYYYYDEVVTLEEIVEPMLVQTEKILEKYKNELKQTNMTIHEVLTLSSIVEEEATASADRAKISSVFHNRLKSQMPLQSCPTVLYALDKHLDKLFYKDLEVESPYNTYKTGDLPVGPIANSGEGSLKATLNPADTDYFYFLATSEGKTLFAKTLNEHNELKSKYIN